MIRRKIGGSKLSRREPTLTKLTSIDVGCINAALGEFIESELGDLLRIVKKNVPNGTVDICLPVFSYVLREAVRVYTGSGGATFSLERTGEREMSFIIELKERPNPESFAPAIALEDEGDFKLDFIDNKIIMRVSFFPKTKLTIRSREKNIVTSELVMTFFIG